MLRKLSDLGFNTVYHITSLHYLPDMLMNGEVVSKRESRRRGLNILPRHTSYEKDIALGFGDYVHNFLLRWSHNNETQAGKPIPILYDKLAKGYPHVCFKIPISFFERPVICWWNIGKGHPRGCCANWPAEALLGFWESEQLVDRDNAIRYRKGFFNEPMKVPTVINLEQLDGLINVVGSKIKQRPLELLQNRSTSISPRGEIRTTIEFFSERDLSLANENLSTETKDNYDFILVNPDINGYTYNQRDNATWRSTRAYYRNRNWRELPRVEFD